MSVILKSFCAPEFNVREILRYAGMREFDIKVAKTTEECLKEAQNAFVYNVCYDEFDVAVTGDGVKLGDLDIISKDLCKNLEGCKKAVVFAATVGLEIDRLIARYSKTAPVKALLMQAIGAERIEALANLFNNYITERESELGNCTRPRFSPGYGDLPLNIQNNIFSYLDCHRKIGLSLNESLLMSPSKSVTAIIGIAENK